MANPKTVKEELCGEGIGPIRAQELAIVLQVPVERLQSLIDHGYLRVVLKKSTLAETIISCPKEEVRQWLQNALQPLHRQPIVRLDDVRLLQRKYYGHVGLKDGRKNPEYTNKLRRICMTYRIPIYIDEEFGELLTIVGLNRLMTRLGIQRNPSPLNRAGMLAYLMNALPNPRYAILKVPRYTRRLDLEIKRITQLPEPQRTIMSMELYTAWRDSRTVQECLNKLHDRREDDAEVIAIRQTDKKMERLKKSATG